MQRPKVADKFVEKMTFEKIFDTNRVQFWKGVEANADKGRVNIRSPASSPHFDKNNFDKRQNLLCRDVATAAIKATA